MDGPGLKLFERLRTALGGLPLIAEDLGLITPDVVALRDHARAARHARAAVRARRAGQPALAAQLRPEQRVLHRHARQRDRERLVRAISASTTSTIWDSRSGTTSATPPWDLIRLAWSSVAAIAIAPLQDVLGLGNEARMNKPGVADGNWRWRFRLDQFRPELIGSSAT